MFCVLYYQVQNRNTTHTYIFHTLKYILFVGNTKNHHLDIYAFESIYIYIYIYIALLFSQVWIFSLSPCQFGFGSSRKVFGSFLLKPFALLLDASLSDHFISPNVMGQFIDSFSLVTQFFSCQTVLWLYRGCCLDFPPIFCLFLCNYSNTSTCKQLPNLSNDDQAQTVHRS